MSFNYYMPTRILFGNGKINELHSQTMPGKKALIVTTAGQSVIKYGYLDRVKEQLKMANVEFVVFNKILPNPILSHVTEGAQLARESGCDFVIGLGGGSSIDSCKSIAVMATNTGNYWDYIDGGTGKGLPVPNSPLPIVAITTTAGTGTEADPWTVITNGNEKIGFGYDKTFPVFSIVDPQMMTTVPSHLTAYQGFDALFHSTEGYLNVTANEMSDLFALKAISLIGKSLAAAVKNGEDIEARGNVALANTLSGIVESTSGCTSEHSIEHALSAYHPQLPHGAGLIMVSLEYYKYIISKDCCTGRFVDMARALGNTGAEKPMDFVTALEKLQKECGVDNLKMSDYQIKKQDAQVLAETARTTMGGLFQVDPCTIDHKATVAIIENSYR